MTERPTVVRNPANDRAFEDAIEDVLRNGIFDPDSAQERLRERYPDAVVRPRGLAGEPPIWYIYRDGRWTAGGVRVDG